MHQTVVRAICAIGQSGQLGLNGVMPWEGNRSPEFAADVARFFEITRGHVLIAGPKTIASVPGFARVDRELFVVRSNMDPEETLKQFAGRIVYIGGGPAVWDAYSRLSAIGTSPDYLMTGRPTAGSVQSGSQQALKTPDVRRGKIARMVDRRTFNNSVVREGDLAGC